MKNFRKIAAKILFFAIFFIFEGFSQNLLFHIDLTDTSKITFGDYTWEGERKITQVVGEGTYSPVFSQSDTSKQPLWRYGEGAYFKRLNSHHLKIQSGQKNFPSTATFIIIARHLGRNPVYYPTYVLGDTSSLIGYDDGNLGLRVYSSSGGYLGERINIYGGLKTILSFRVNSNTIDTMFINGFTQTSSVTLGNNLKGGIIGAYYSGTTYNRFWSGYIYEILVYDAALTNKQLDSLHKILSDKHHIAYKIIEPEPIPHSSQALQGTGTANDPYLIYTAWHLDSLRFIYPKYTDSTVYIKLMNDIDLSNHMNLTIDTLLLNIDGNHKKLKNLSKYGSTTNDRYALINLYDNYGSATVKNLVIENFAFLVFTGIYSGVSYSSFLYASQSSSKYISADSVIFKKCFMRGEVPWAYRSYYSLISRYITSAKRIGIIDCEIITGSENQGYLLNTTLDRVFTNKHTLLGVYNTNGSEAKSFLSEFNTSHKNCFFRHKSFNLNYSAEEETANFYYFSSGIKAGYSDKIYFNLNVIYSWANKIYETISFDSWTNITHNLDSTFIDTTYNRKFSLYPVETYSGNLPQVKTSSEMKQQSTYVSFDFDSTWAINPTINDGYPYLTFAIPEESPLKVIYPNSVITKTTRDTLNIQFTSSLDTTNIYFINNNDTLFIDKTTNTSYVFTILPKKTGLSKILIRSTDNQFLDASDTTFIVIRDTTITFYEPYLYQQFDRGDSANVIFSSDLDTAKFYFKFNPSSQWEYKGFKALSDTLDTFKIYLDYDFTDKAQIMITNNDSTVMKVSDYFYILPIRFIEILEPNENNVTLYTSGVFVKVRSKNLSDFDLFVKTNDDYTFHKNYSTANSGGIDTTTFILDYKQYLLSGNLTIMVRKGDIGEIRGSMDTAYYKQNQFTYAGMRSPYPQFQSRTNFSKIYELEGNLYSICFYAYAYGWYDWWDRVEIYKFNQTTNFFNLTASRVFPHIAPYPMFLFYRTGIYSAALLKPSIYYYPISYYLLPDTIYQINEPTTISGLNPAPINIDAERTLEVQANFWKYKIEGNKIYAYDLKNQGNNFMLADLTNISAYLTGIKPNAFELFAGAGKLFITNHSYTDQNSRADTYFLNLFPANDILTMDEKTIFITGTQRNTFRGIYPKAIIKVIPKL